MVRQARHGYHDIAQVANPQRRVLFLDTDKVVCTPIIGAQRHGVSSAQEAALLVAAVQLLVEGGCPIEELAAISPFRAQVDLQLTESVGMAVVILESASAFEQWGIAHEQESMYHHMKPMLLMKIQLQFTANL